jgi:lactoylglutathione lyase
MEIDYIALFVSDVSCALTFYRDVLGFQFNKAIAEGGTEGYSGSLKIGIYDRSWLTKLFGDQGDQSINSHSFLLSMSVNDLDATYQHLLQCKALDLEAVKVSPPKVMPWGQKIIFLTDPDGNLLEIVEKRSLS